MDFPSLSAILLTVRNASRAVEPLLAREAVAALAESGAWLVLLETLWFWFGAAHSLSSLIFAHSSEAARRPTSATRSALLGTGPWVGSLNALSDSSFAVSPAHQVATAVLIIEARTLLGMTVSWKWTSH